MSTNEKRFVDMSTQTKVGLIQQFPNHNLIFVQEDDRSVLRSYKARVTQEFITDISLDLTIEQFLVQSVADQIQRIIEEPDHKLQHLKLYSCSLTPMLGNKIVITFRGLID